MKKKIGKNIKKVAKSCSSSECSDIRYSNKYIRSKSDSQINLFKQLTQAFEPSSRSKLQFSGTKKQDRSKVGKMSSKDGGGGKKSLDTPPPPPPLPPNKMFSEFPLADSVVLNEIREAEQTANQAASQIAEMRDQIQKLTQKDELTPAEMEELQMKQKDIVRKLAEFEEVTKKIQDLVGLASGNYKEDPNSSKPKKCVPGHEPIPVLPRVIIPHLGPAAEQINQVMVCDKFNVGPNADEDWYKAANNQNPSTSQYQGNYQPNQPQMDWMQPPNPDPQNDQCCEPPIPDFAAQILEQLTEKLDASYRIQEKLAQENKNMECERYQLQEELLSRDKQTDSVCKQLESMQCELKLITAENCDLKKKIKSLCEERQQVSDGPPAEEPKPLCKMSLSKNPICKLDLYKQMGLPLPVEGTTGAQTIPAKTMQLGDMDAVVSSMEEEVRAMQKELSAVQAERRSLDLQKKLLKCAAPRATTTFPVCKRQVELAASTESDPQLEQAPQQPSQGPPPPPPPPKPQPQCMRELENQLKELSEQYAKLNQDFNNKVAEVSVLRVEADKFREEKKMLVQKREDDQNRVDHLITRLRTLEEEKDKWSGTKGAMLDIEQQMIMFKQKYVEKQELEDELKILVGEQTQQLDDYRNKYIKAQEIVEGQRRDMDVMQKNHLRFSEQLTKELKTAKEEFQKRLEELSRLPDILKTTQQKLQESQQMRMIAEQNVEQLTTNLEEFKEKIEVMQVELEKSNLELADQNKENVDEGKLKIVLSEMEEKVLDLERQLEARRQHVVMLEGQLESLREESARSLTRTKERCEVVRRGLQNQISDLEVQLAQARASARAAQKDRDLIREKMECQVQKLTKNFEEAQNWVKCLQSHVGFLKSSNRDVEFASQPVDCLPKHFQPIAID